MSLSDYTLSGGAYNIVMFNLSSRHRVTGERREGHTPQGVVPKTNKDPPGVVLWSLLCIVVGVRGVL